MVREPWGDRSRKDMVFFKEPQEVFSLLSILQMGRNYEANEDGYVYVYAPNGNTAGTMNELVMFRVPKLRFLLAVRMNSSPDAVTTTAPTGRRTSTRVQLCMCAMWFGRRNDSWRSLSNQSNFLGAI